MRTNLWIKSLRMCFASLLQQDGNMRKKMFLAQSLGQLVPGVPFSYHNFPKDTHYICRHLLSSNYDECINIKTIAFPKNTASRNSDGWHLCRQDFIQLLWLASGKNKWEFSPFFPLHFYALVCFIKKKKTRKSRPEGSEQIMCFFF